MITIIANIIMFAGCILLVLAGATKNPKLTVGLQTGQLAFAATANILLGAYTGAVLNVVAILRNLVVLKDKYIMPVRIGFVFIVIAAGIATNDRGALGYGITMGNAVFTASLGAKRKELVKLALAFCVLWWALYDFANKNYVGAAFDVATFMSSIVGYFRMRREMEKEE